MADMVFLSLSTMLKAKIIQSLQHHRSGNVTRVENPECAMHLSP